MPKPKPTQFTWVSLLYTAILDTNTNCYNLQTFKDKNGYSKVRYKGKRIRTHRLMWELFNNKSIPEGLCVCHTCDNPSCINPSHLWLGTKSDNMRDKINKRRSNLPSGENHPSSKLQWTDVHIIKELYKKQSSLTAIGNQFNISASHVHQIVNNRLWVNEDIKEDK